MSMKMMRPFVVAAANLVSSTVAETNPVYSALDTYDLNDVVREDTADGTFEYKSLADSNLGNPLTDTSKWEWLGASNRWRAFDRLIAAQTEQADTAGWVFDVDGRIDGVSIINVEATEVQIVATDAVDGVVFDKTVGLISTEGITDIFSYLSEPIDLIADKHVSGIPTLYADLQISATINNAGSTVKVGEVIPSLSRTIGDAQYGATVGIRDFSRKDTDDFGNPIVVKRSFSKRANFTVWMARSQTDQTQTLLARYRATPIVYQGSESYNSTLVYGYFRDANVELAGPVHSLLSIDVEGLSQ